MIFKGEMIMTVRIKNLNDFIKAFKDADKLKDFSLEGLAALYDHLLLASITNNKPEIDSVEVIAHNYSDIDLKQAAEAVGIELTGDDNADYDVILDELSTRMPVIFSGRITKRFLVQNH